MKNFVFVLILTAVCIQTSAQQPDSVFTKKTFRTTAFDYLFSYYQQDGNHSAVTGGVGTEELTVFINQVSITHVADSINTLFLTAGIDVISSASTDNIDLRISSASANDNRLWFSLGYQRNTTKQHSIGVQSFYSIESDYLSWGGEGWWNHQNKLNNWRYGVSFQVFVDDLRWGRLNEDFKAPVTVVYPKELRDSVWFDIYNRYSYNFNISLQHDINKRMSIGFFPGIMWQEGLLSTPFHRFYFKDSTNAVVETLPQKRIKVPLGVQLNSFVGNKTVFKIYYRYYWDSFSILAHTLQVEMPTKVIPQLTISPFVRVYNQRKSTYFFAYKTILPTEPYFTADYDLSGFSSTKVGLECKLTPVKNSFITQIAIRYAYYSRSDGLKFNQLSSYFSVK